MELSGFHLDSECKRDAVNEHRMVGTTCPLPACQERARRFTGLSSVDLRLLFFSKTPQATGLPFIDEAIASSSRLFGCISPMGFMEEKDDAS